MLEEGVSTELDLSMRFAVKNTEALTFVTDPHTVIMTKDMLDTHNVDNNAHKELLDKKVDENTFTTELAKKVDEIKLTTELAKKANTSHSHSVSDITNTMTIAKGGTGATSASTALTNLGGFPTAGGTITGNTTIQGNLTLKGLNSNYGNKINFGDGDYVHISEPTDDNMEIKANNVNFVVSGNVTQNGKELGGSVTREQIQSALQNNNYAIALGSNALINLKNYSNTGSVAIGAFALKNVTGGEHNIAIGHSALIKQTAYNDNVAIGYKSLGNSTQGYYNTANGCYALQNLTTYYNCIGLGYNSQVTGNNQVQLGDSSVTVYAQKALVTRSDARDKIDIEDSPLGLNFILKLRPCKYRMNSREAYFEKGQERDFTATNDGSKAGKRPHYGYGLIAQEVKEVMNELGVDFAGYLDSKVDGGEDVLSLGYTEFIAPMIKAIQEQQQMIEELQKQIEEFKK